MKVIALAILMSALAFDSMTMHASAQSTSACEAQAIGKDGKALSGAAKTASVNKCMKEYCTTNAVDKNGKKLSGAAKSAFLKKCQGG